jgi:hypothetical protein
VKEDPPPSQRHMQSIRHTQLRFMSVSRAHEPTAQSQPYGGHQHERLHPLILLQTAAAPRLESPELEPWP